jgi:hypothetical protein
MQSLDSIYLYPGRPFIHLKRDALVIAGFFYGLTYGYGRRGRRTRRD